MGLALPAGCAGSLNRHYADVEQVVKARTGQDITWLERSSTAGAPATTVLYPIPDRLLTVSDAERIALVNNPELRATLGEIGIARADLVQSGLPDNPKLAMRYRWQTEGDASDNKIAVSQEFMGLLVMPLRRQVAKRQLEQAKARVAAAALDLASQVRIAFYTLQGRLQARERQREFVASLASAAELGRRMRLVGDLSEHALLARELALSQARQDLAGIELQIETDREQLNRLMNLTGIQASTWNITGNLPEPPQNEPSPGDLETLALDRRLDLTAVHEENKAIHETIKLQQLTRWIPVLQVGVDYERKTNKSKVIGPTIGLELPLFDWGQARIARSRALLDQNQQRMAALETAIRSEVRELLKRRDAARAAVQAYREEILPRAERLALLDQAGGGEGSPDPTDWLKDQQDEGRARQEYVQALRDYWITRTRLEFATGGFQ